MTFSSRVIRIPIEVSCVAEGSEHVRPRSCYAPNSSRLDLQSKLIRVLMPP